MECLIIDDNVKITTALSLVLKSQNVVATAINDPRKGLEEISNKNYDLILMDLAMPGFSGHDIIKALKDSGEIESKNIVIVTASSKSDEEPELLSMGVKEILRKPVSISDLKKLIIKYGPK